MGTSQSSDGPSSNVPLVPPWVPGVPVQPGNPGSPDGDSEPQPTPGTHNNTLVSVSGGIAPPARFGGARRSLSAYAKSGTASDLRRGLGHYVRTGYGGAQTTSKRLAGTARNAARLYSSLSGAPSPTTGESVPLDADDLAGRTASEVMDRVVDAVAPVDGSLDAEASRDAIKEALSDVLAQFPEASLLELTEEQRIFAIERYVALDVFRRFFLDVGKTIQSKAPNAKAALSRFKEVKEYIKQVVAAAFRRAREKGEIINATRTRRVVQGALTDALQVFQDYAT